MKKFFHQSIITTWAKYCAVIISFVSTLYLFIPSFEGEKQYINYIIGGCLLFLLISSYFIIALVTIKSKKVSLVINNTKVNIFFGYIFNQKGYKVIAFNEYYDTIVDDEIIAHISLNGQIIDKGYINPKDFDKEVELDTKLRTREVNLNRIRGNKKAYYIGQVHKHKDYFALAFSKFNEKNEAYLKSNEYACCLLEMWSQLNTQYAQEIISLPLLGDGITRIIDNIAVTKQELLEIMLQTLTISKMTFKEPSKINIVLYPGKNNEYINKFDFVKIKEMFK